MPEKPEEGFQVVDKRRVTAEGTPRSNENTTAAAGGEGAATGAAPPPTEGAAGTAPGEARAPAETGAASGTKTEAPGAAPGEKKEPLPPIGAREVVVFCINQLHEIAWSRMGLTPNPTSGTIARDLADARLAIDCVAALVQRLEPEAEPTMRRELQNMLANLRLNFVQQSQRG